MKCLLKFLLLLPGIFTCGHIYAQKQGQAHVDSLLQALPKQQEDSNKVNILQDLSFSYCTINAEKGIKYGQQALVLATKLNWEKGVAYAHNSLGNNYQKLSDYASALNSFLIALKIAEKSADKRLTAIINGNIGLVYQNKNDLLKALEYDLKALKIDEEMGYKRGLATVSGNIGIVYKKQKK